MENQEYTEGRFGSRLGKTEMNHIGSLDMHVKSELSNRGFTESVDLVGGYEMVKTGLREQYRPSGAITAVITR